MEIRYRKGFEDVIVAADDVVRHFQCHFIPSLSHYTAQTDVRFLFSQAVRNVLGDNYSSRSTTTRIPDPDAASGER